MKLLFLTPQLPYPPNKGTAMRNYGLIGGLAERHDIDVLTFADADGLRAARASPLAAACRSIDALPAPTRSMARRALTTALSPWPDMALRLWSTPLAARLARRLRERDYDIVQVEGIEMARYGLLARRLAPRARWVFDDHNAEWLLQRRTYEAERDLAGWSLGAIYSLIQTWKLRRFERKTGQAADCVVAVSPGDASAIRELDPGLRVCVVPNGIETAHYRRDAVTPVKFDAPTLVFSGTMDFRPNVDAVLWFATHVLPELRAAAPALEFVVVGQRPHARLDALRGGPGIRIIGAVDDVRPYLAGAAVCVVPLRMGGGTRLKVLEALAMQTPVVSTSLGVDGFEVENGREVIIADDPHQFTAGVLGLLEPSGRRQALVERGRQFAETRYDWRVIVPKMEEMYSVVSNAA